MKKCKFVYTSHTPFWTLSKREFDEGRYNFKSYLDKISMKLADKSIAISYAQKKGLAEKTGIDEKKIIVIENGVDIDKFYPGKKNENGKIKIISVARISRVKNQLMIIKTIPKIIKKNRNIEFNFIGQLEEKDYLKKINQFIKRNKIEEYAKISGPIDHDKLPFELRKADVFISASRAEGFPLSVLEAMASGCAIIISDIEPHLEISKNSEIIFFKQDDEKELVNKLLRIIGNKNLREELQKKALESARKNYSWKSVVLKNKKIYERIKSS